MNTKERTMMKLAVDKKNPSPLYMQVKDHIKNFILDNKMGEGESLPPMGRLSKMAGVSLKTTDKALNELIREGVCYRRPKKGTFVGSKQDFSHKHRICGLYHEAHVSSLETDLVDQQIYSGIQNIVRTQNMDLFFITGDAIESISRYRRSSDIDLVGLAMLRWHGLDEGRRLAEKFPDIRFVYLNFYVKGIEQTPNNVYGVFSDEFSGAYQMTDFLLQKGHRRIALAALDLKDENYRQRIEGYKKAFEDNGLRIDDDLIRLKEPGDGFHNVDIGGELGLEILAMKEPPTAIFCINDELACGMVKKLRQIDRIDDVEVVGHDNIIPLLSQEYGFSTVAINFKKMGQLAMNIMADPQSQYSKIMKVTPQLVIRNGSTRSV